MIKPRLQQVLNQVLYPTLEQLLAVVPEGVLLEDTTGQSLLGKAHPQAHCRVPIVVENEVIAWVIGTEQSSRAVADLLTYLFCQEWLTLALGQEMLDRYRELDLLYNIASQLAHHRDLQAIATLALNEASKAIKCTSASVMLLQDADELLMIVAGQGTALFGLQKFSFRPGYGIAGHILQTGVGEVIPDATMDPRFVLGPYPVRSLICVPLKAGNQVIGVINLSHEQVIGYTTGDLKLVTTIASQIAPALHNTLLYEHELEQVKIREAALEQKLHQLQIEIDQDKRAKRVSEITETDYFRGLQNKVKKLREDAP